MTDDHNKDSNPDFEDETFDEVDFDESYYEDDAAYDDAVVADDVDFEDVDFDEVDWNEEEEPVIAGKRNPHLRSEKKSFLSFNTIVILGAVIAGAGVLVFTVMDKSAQVASTVSPKFRSGLNIGEIMDGTIFGLGDKNQDSADAPAQEQDEETAAVDDVGFLNDPDTLELQATATDLPPQPTPISPTETAKEDQTLTPMPRGPEEFESEIQEAATDPVSNDVRDDSATLSAEEVLKRALASREKKQEEKERAEPVADLSGLKDKSEPVLVEPLAEEPASAMPAPQPEPVDVAESIEPTVVQPLPVVTNSAPALAVAEEASEGVKALEGKIDALLKRMEQIEGELSTVREGRKDEYQSLEKTVSALKSDIVELKKAPAPVAKKEPAPAKETPAAAPPKKAAAPAAPVKKAEPAYTPPKQAVQDTAAWELRAAQPGKAWVSRAGQRDMQGVVVGETLPGIGKITAISYQGGRWVVVGSQGEIRQ